MKTTQNLTRTAVLLALTLAFQALRFIPFIAAMRYNTYLIGTLVNLALIIAVLSAPLSTSIFISIVTPIVAFIQGHLKFPVMIPVVALGNVIYCVLFYLGAKRSKSVGIIIGSVFKWVFLYMAASFVFKEFVTVPPAMLQTLIATFNIPQIVTALLGGVLAVYVHRSLPKNLVK